MHPFCDVLRQTRCFEYSSGHLWVVRWLLLLKQGIMILPFSVLFLWCTLGAGVQHALILLCL